MYPRLCGRNSVSIFHRLGKKRMNRTRASITLKTVLAIFLMVLGSSSIAYGNSGVPDKLQYDFEEIQVLYAAEFLAYPPGHVPNSDNAQAVTHSVYGTVSGSVYQPMDPNAVRVLYGVVQLGTSTIEEFIKVTSPHDSVRGLSNSGSYFYYENSNRLKEAVTSFNSGKKLEGKSVVKDYSASSEEVTLSRRFDPYSNITGMTLTWSRLGQTYEVDMNSLRHKGNQALTN
jgi:hypothetical protein